MQVYFQLKFPCTLKNVWKNASFSLLKRRRALERVQNIKRNRKFNVLLQYLLPWLLLLLTQRFQILPVHQFVTNSYCSPCTVILPVLRRLILFLLPFAQPPPVQASNSYHVLIYRFFCHRICFSFFFGELQIPLALQFIAIFFLHSLQFFFLLLLLFLLLPLPDFFSTGFAFFLRPSPTVETRRRGWKKRMQLHRAQFIAINAQNSQISRASFLFNPRLRS